MATTAMRSSRFRRLTIASASRTISRCSTPTKESNGDEDLGSGGEMLLPDLQDAQANTWHLGVGAGKDGHIYVVNRDLMGKFNTNNDSAIYQEIDSSGLGGGVWSMPAYFNNMVYYGAVGDRLRAFSISEREIDRAREFLEFRQFRLPGDDAEHFGARDTQRELCGRWRIMAEACCTLTTRRTSPRSCTTAIRPRITATILRTTNSSRR